MSQAGIYHELKPVWWLVREGSLPSAPKQVQLILSDSCNQNCGFCAYRLDGYSSNELFVGNSPLLAYGHNNPKRWIPTDRALSLLDEFKEVGVLAVQFTGGGEPTFHPDHDRIFAKALGLGLRCSLVSNAVSWKHGIIEGLLPKFDWVRISIDAGNRESYAKTRQCPVTHWDKAWDNIYRLVANCSKLTGTAIGLGFVVTPQSYKEIPEFTAKAFQSGVGNVRFTAMFSNANESPFIPIYDEIRHLINQAKQEYGREGFAVYDNFGSRFADLAQKAPDYSFCGYQHYTTYVGGDLKAYRCCVLAYNQRGLIEGGDLATQSFADFWRGLARRNDFWNFDARGCERCQFNEKNRAIAYVIGDTESDTSPRHMEFT